MGSRGKEIIDLVDSDSSNGEDDNETNDGPAMTNTKRQIDVGGPGDDDIKKTTTTTANVNARKRPPVSADGKYKADDVDVIDLTSNDYDDRRLVDGSGGTRENKKQKTRNNNTTSIAERNSSSLPATIAASISIDNNNPISRVRAILEPGDDAVMTSGIMESISSTALSLSSSQSLNGRAVKLYWTCIPSRHPNEGTISFVAQHIQQNDQWSCGYRNYQMMLSAMLPRLDANHSIFQRIPHRIPPTPMGIPTLKQMQRAMEDAWREGFDRKGARHYSHCIVGTESKIGAMEVVNLSWYHGIDSTVVQFIRCSGSRNLLPFFVHAYFAKNTGGSWEDGNSNNKPTSCSMANSLLSEAFLASEGLTKIASHDPSSNNYSKMEPLLPLYLQWEGHSVTIIGVEVQRRENITAVNDIALLVLDPLKQGRKIQRDLHCCQGRKPSILPVSIRLPWKKIMNKDLQIMLCTNRSMTYQERNQCMINGDKIRVITAAQDAVIRAAKACSN